MSTPSSVTVRNATAGDAAAIAAIYAHHVLHGSASYDLVPPTGAETVAQNGRVTGRGWRFLVACDGAEEVGYWVATQFRQRPAYAHSFETRTSDHQDPRRP